MVERKKRRRVRGAHYKVLLCSEWGQERSPRKLQDGEKERKQTEKEEVGKGLGSGS